MNKGHFYFISDKFYRKYDTKKNMMTNKDAVDGKPHSRPCFFTFPDKVEGNIYWMVPISSKVDKYRKIHDSKIEKERNKGVTNPRCDTIRFGKVMGFERAFLIQNMFPVSDNYIVSAYIDKNTKKEVTIDRATERDIINSATKVLRLSRRGVMLLYADVETIYKDLLEELSANSKGEDELDDENPSPVT